MKFSPRPQGFSPRLSGWALVLGLHLLLGWALASGLATQVVHKLSPPVQVALIAEAPPPLPLPPPPPPPAVPKASPPQKIVAAAPPVARPPVVPAMAAEAPSPSAITPTPPAATVAPEAVAAAAPLPPPTAPAPRPAPLAMGLVCPTQVSPVMPRRATQESIHGRVEARATVRGGRVVAVEILSARPRGVFEAAVKQAMLQYRCETRGEADVQADQVFDFKFED